MKGNKLIENYERFFGERLGESETETGIYVHPDSEEDTQKIINMLDREGYHAEYDERDNTFFFPEDEQSYDALEMSLTNEFSELGIEASFEGIFNEEEAEYLELDEESSDRPKLKLVGTDGNAFSLLAKAQRVAKQNDMDWDKIQKEAMSGDYNHLLQVLMKYFDVV